MERRRFLTALAAAAAGATAASCSSQADEAAPAADPSTPPVPPPPPTDATPSEVAHTRFPAPTDELMVLPGTENTLLLGVDDGINAQAIRDWCSLVSSSNVRLVFFGNGCYSSWQEVKPVLAPLLEEGRIQLGNHTLDHPKLTQCSDAEVVRQLRENARVFKNLYGVDMVPWFRPPYGLHNARVDAIAAGEGYHAPVTWNCSFLDWNTTSTAIYEQRAAECFTPRQVVLAHANKPDMAAAHPTFLRLLRERDLKTVTLDDVFQR